MSQADKNTLEKKNVTPMKNDLQKKMEIISIQIL